MTGEWERFVQVFEHAARQAGAVARHLQGKVRLERKSGYDRPEAAALTPVDLAAQDVILLALHAAFPEAAVDAEEETETVALFPPADPSRPLVVVDPIDGSLNYGEGSPDYAVMAAWLDGGRYRASVVRFPAWGLGYSAVDGQGARVDRGSGPEPLGPGEASDRILVTREVPEGWRRALEEAGFAPVRTRCSAVDATAPVNGRGCASLSVGRPSRRRAIGFLIAREAGAVVRVAGRPWEGEDSRDLPRGRHPILAARDAKVARRIEAALATTTS